MKIFAFLSLFTLLTTFSWAQHTITGIVIDPNDKSPLPGVKVYEDSINQTMTDRSGQFSIEVKELPTRLTFAFIGMLTRTIDVHSDTSLTVSLKPYVLRHYYDSQKFGIFTSSGVLNTTLGGKLYLTTPYIFDQLLIKSSFNYQTNLDDNTLLRASVSLDNIIIDRPHFALGISGYYQELGLDNYNLVNKSVELDMYVGRIPFDFSIGYSKLDITEENIKTSYDGLIFGFSKYFHEPLKISVSSKIHLYEGLVGFEAQLNKSIKRLEIFTRYQHLDSFSELSLGVGYMITYIFNDPNKY